MKEYNNLIQIHKALEHSLVLPYHKIISRPIVADIVRNTLEEVRNLIKEKKIENVTTEYIINECVKSLEYAKKSRLQVVINATGTILHTNLGRSPINKNIWDNARDVNIYSNNLEYDINLQKRGKRATFLYKLISKITSFESALVVNNNAGAIFLILTSLAKGREVIVSRGEQVQIGGGFRVPDILREAGCTLVEVGTTNITTIDDYKNAINENTAFILKVHTSNFKIRGFSDSPSLALLRKSIDKNIPIIYDEGAGILDDESTDHEDIYKAFNANIDLVCFSGDKIFGSVQAGIIAGRSDLINIISKHPLMRAFRVGKTIISILEEYAINKLNNSDDAINYSKKILDESMIEAKRKASILYRHLKEHDVSVTEASVETGGGAMPDTYFPSYALSIKHKNIKKVLSDMQMSSIPIIAKIKNDAILIYTLTIDTSHINYVKETLLDILNKN